MAQVSRSVLPLRFWRAWGAGKQGTLTLPCPLEQEPVSQEGSPGPTGAAVASSGRAQSLPPSLHKSPNVAPSTWQRAEATGRELSACAHRGSAQAPSWATLSHWAPGTLCWAAGRSSAARRGGRGQRLEVGVRAGTQPSHPKSSRQPLENDPSRPTRKGQLRYPRTWRAEALRSREAPGLRRGSPGPRKRATWERAAVLGGRGTRRQRLAGVHGGGPRCSATSTAADIVPNTHTHPTKLWGWGAPLAEDASGEGHVATTGTSASSASDGRAPGHGATPAADPRRERMWEPRTARRMRPMGPRGHGGGGVGCRLGFGRESAGLTHRADVGAGDIETDAEVPPTLGPAVG